MIECSDCVHTLGGFIYGRLDWLTIINPDGTGEMGIIFHIHTNYLSFPIEEWCILSDN